MVGIRMLRWKTGQDFWISAGRGRSLRAGLRMEGRNKRQSRREVYYAMYSVYKIRQMRSKYAHRAFRFCAFQNGSPYPTSPLRNQLVSSLLLVEPPLITHRSISLLWPLPSDRRSAARAARHLHLATAAVGRSRGRDHPNRTHDQCL